MQPKGEKKVIRISIDPQASNHSLGYWDSSAQKWTIADGHYWFYFGRSSADIVLYDTVTLQTRPDK